MTRGRAASWPLALPLAALLTGAAGLLAEPPAPAPAPAPARAPVAAQLRLKTPRGGQTRERVVTIVGECPGVRAERLTLLLNGVPLSIPREGTAFSTVQVLAPGANAIRVRVEQDGRTLEDSVEVYARVPPKDLRVTLTWDTPGTDVDLWVTGPDGERVFYGHRQGRLGGTLDTDVTTGHGPETYTLARLSPGSWRVQAHYFRGGTPTWVEVNLIEREGQPDESRRRIEGLLLAAGDVLELGEVQAK